MTDKRKPILAEDCPCVQKRCPLRGNCVVCVRSHRTHREHLPECMLPIFRDLVTQMAKKVELDVSEARPKPEFWDNLPQETWDELEKMKSK